MSEGRTEQYSEEESVKKLTEWKNEPSLSDLKQNYDDAKIDHQSQVNKIELWRDYRNIKGKAKPKYRKGYSQVQPKLIRKQNEWRYSALTDPFLSTPDIFNVYPVTSQDVKRARQNALVLNNQFNTQLDKQEFIDDYVQSAVDDGTVIVKVGWESKDEIQTKEIPVFKFVPDLTGQTVMQYQNLLGLMKQAPDTFEQKVEEGWKQGLQIFLQTGQATIPQLEGYEEVEEEVEIVNQPTLEVCDPRNVVIDPSCKGNIKKAQFVAYTFETNLSALEKDGRYTNLESINTQGMDRSPLSEPDHETSEDFKSFTFKDRPRQVVIVYEWWGEWDIDGNGITKPIVAAWVGDTLIRLEENPCPDKKHPFVAVSYLHVRNSAYGEPDAELLDENQDIIGALVRGMLDLLGRSANAQTGMQKGMLDPINKRKFMNGQDYEFNGNGRDPRLGLHTHVYPEIPQSAYNLLTINQNEAESLTGVKAFTGGISGAALGETNGQVKSALDATSKREASILRRLARGIIDIGRKIVAYNAEFLSDEEIVRISDEEFVPVRRDDLAGKFDIRLSISTAEEDESKAQELSFMLQTIGPHEDPEVRKIILSNICRLRKMPELAERIEKYQPQPDPMQQKKIELELLLLEAQIQNEFAMAEDKGASAQERMAGIQERYSKIQLNMAKVRELGSKADLDDLNFLEQESGVKQERDLQKIKGQAEAQTKMKIIEAALNQKREQ